MKSIFKFFNFKFLILGIIFGFFALRYTDTDKRVVRVWPTPNNIDVIQYKDTANNCFNFENIVVDCPSNPDDIHTIPIQ